MERVANMFAARLDSSQQNQQRMFELCPGGHGNGSHGSNAALPGLVDLSVPRTLAYRRLPTMTLADAAASTPRKALADSAAPSLTASPAASHLSPASSLAAQSPLALVADRVGARAGDSSPAGVVGQAPAQEAKEEGDDEQEEQKEPPLQRMGDAPPNPMQLLDNFLGREADKRLDTKAKRAAKNATSVEEALVDASAAVEAPKAKGKAKGKAKAGKAVAPGAPAKRKASDGSDMVRVGRPSFGVERSRSQVMCRTGFKGLEI